jgi:hypothetical protein
MAKISYQAVVLRASMGWLLARDALVMHDCLRIGVPDLSRRFFVFALRESVLPGR